MGIYVTETGFDKRTFQQLVVYYTTLFKSIWGTEVDLNPEQATGQLLDFLASTDAQGWDVAQDIYTSNDVRNAVGVSLDNNVGALIGILRQDATKAIVLNTVFFGTEGAVVPSLTARVRNTTTIDADRVTFSLDNDVTILQAAAREIWYSVDFDVLNTYSIELDGDVKAIGAQADASAVVDAFVTLLEAEGPQVYNAANVDVGGLPQLRVWFSQVISDPLSSTFDAGATLKMDVEKFGSPGNVTALTEGFINVDVGFIDQIAVGSTGWAEVYNTDPKTVNTGTGVELDPEYRKQLQFGIASSGLATESAIRRVVLNQVAAVLTCIVRSNRTLVALPAPPPTNGQQPKSFQTYVDGVGPLVGAPTADQQLLANAIFEAAGAGIEIFGTEGPIDVIDDDGGLQVAFYSLVATTAIDVIVNRDLYEEFNPYPVDGDDQIKAALVAYTAEQWVIDKDVIPSRLLAPMYISVLGIGEAFITCRINGSGDPFTTDVIPIDAFNIASLEVADIIVQDIP